MMEIEDKELSSLIVEYHTKKEDFEQEKDSLAKKPLIKRLAERGRLAMEEVIEEWLIDVENGSTRKEPTTLPYKTIAEILREEIIFVRFNDEEGTKVALYLEDEGIYTINLSHVRNYIKVIDSNSTKYTADEIIYDLKTLAKVKEQTHSRYLIPCNNGVFNLKTKELEPFTPDYLFTSKISTDYVDYSRKPQPIINGWNVNEWIAGIADDDKEVDSLLWQVISACLNGNYTRRKAIWLYSQHGSSGKGTFQQLITNVVGGSNVASLKLPDFENRFATSMLEGKVCVIGDDVQANIYIEDSSTFQSVVTGDWVTVERKFEHSYSTQFHMTVVQSSNGLPRYKNFTDGTERRFLIVPFNKKFKGSGDDWKIKDEYIHNKEILEYVLYKAINLDFERFLEPDVSKALLEDFAQHNSSVLEFKAEVLDEVDLTAASYTILFNAYKNYCSENNYKAVAKRKFIKELKDSLSPEWESGANIYISEALREEYRNANSKLDHASENDLFYPLPNTGSRSKGISKE